MKLLTFLESRECRTGLEKEGESEVIGSDSSSSHFPKYRNGLLWRIARSISPDDEIPWQRGGMKVGMEEERAAIAEISGGR